MPRYVENAIEIVTDDGRGIVLGYSNAAIGLATDGHFALITGRPTISSVTGDTTRTTWYKNILAQDSKSYLPSWAADFIEAGCFQEISSLEFAIKNTSAFYKTCEDNGIYLTGCRIIYYEVTSDDGAIWNFDRQWSGKIGDQPFNELTYRVKCNDDSRDIFKNLPIQSVNDASFEGAKDKDKMIPIAIGRVAHSPLVNVADTGTKIALCLIDGVEHFVAAATNGSTNGLRLYTKGKSFSLNDSALVGKYLSVIAGGVPQAIRIKANDATGIQAPETFPTTFIRTEEPPDDSTPFSFWTLLSTSTAVWYCQVVDYAPNLVASFRPIYEFIKNSSGREILSTYSSDLKKYSDVSEINFSSSLSNIKATGFPGFSIISKSADADGDPVSYFRIAPTSAIVVAKIGWNLGDDMPAVGVDAPVLYDGLGTNFYTFSKSAGATTIALITIDVEVPRDDVLKQFNELYLLVDAGLSQASSSNTLKMDIVVDAYDIYGRACTDLAQDTIYDGPVGTSEVILNLLPGRYYNATRDDLTFYEHKADLAIQGLIGNTKKAESYNKIRVTIQFLGFGSGIANTIKIRQIGMIGKRSVGVASDSVYCALKGETFGTTWGGRMTPSAPILTLPDTIEHPIRNYDISAPVWRAGQVIAVGKQIRPTADNNHVFICTVAGITHATTEPTWTTTAGATYTDGTVTWKQFKEIPIDITSFNSLGSRRGTWFVGRTLTEKKKSFDYYKQLFQQGFLIGLIDRFGKLKCKAWLDEATPLVTFDSTNIIPGTLEDMDSSPITIAYTEILVRYDWNPGAEKFNKQITVTKADHPVFPGPNELAVPGVDLGTFTIEYVYPVGGLYQYIVTTDVNHGLSTGQYVMLSENTEGYSFPPTAISVVATNAFRFLSSQAPVAPTSTSGILVHATSTALLWKTYVTGIANYAFARDELWGPCHDAWAICKTTNKLPSELGDCHWFIDPYATNPDGGYTWSDDGGRTCNLDVGDDHPAANHAKHLCNWSAWQKKMPTFQVPNEAAYSIREIGDCAYFNDAKQTAGLPLLGWISRKTKMARDDENPERWLFGLILRPEARVDRLILDENLSGGDVYDENLPATDELDEN